MTKKKNKNIEENQSKNKENQSKKKENEDRDKEEKSFGDPRRKGRVYLEKDNPRQNLSFFLMLVSVFFFLVTSYRYPNSYYQDVFFVLFMGFASLDVFFKRSLEKKKTYLYINLVLTIVYLIVFVIFKPI